MRAWIIGYTGVVGRQVVNELLTRPEIKEVTLIGRRELASIADHPNKAKVHWGSLTMYPPCFFEFVYHTQ